jgi:XRE family transcriptional regulator, fatty acid utilization regulator
MTRVTLDVSPMGDHGTMDDLPGRRLAAVRASRHLTQRRLAERAHVSVSLITKVETGARVATPALMAACARALGVAETDLIDGSDHQPSADPTLDRLRTALDLLDTDPDPDVPARPVAELAVAVHDVNRTAQAARYRQAATALPGLLAELHLAATTSPTGDRAHALLTEATRVGHTTGLSLGRPDLSALALARMDQAAQRSGRYAPGWRAVRDYLRITTTMRSKDFTAARRLHRAALQHLDGTDLGDPGIVVARGQLHLGAAVIAARTGDADGAHAELEEARRMAEMTGENHLEEFWMGFGPANVSSHRVIVAIELGECAKAITLGERIDFPSGWLPSRIGHLHLDLARAHLWTANPDGALAALRNARSVAPQQAHRHPSARATIEALMRGRRPNEAVRAFAAWMAS